jgi:hypothetical protein
MHCGDCIPAVLEAKLLTECQHCDVKEQGGTCWKAMLTLCEELKRSETTIHSTLQHSLGQQAPESSL